MLVAAFIFLRGNILRRELEDMNTVVSRWQRDADTAARPGTSAQSYTEPQAGGSWLKAPSRDATAGSAIRICMYPHARHVGLALLAVGTIPALVYGALALALPKDAMAP